MALGRAPKIISEITEFIQDLKRQYADTQVPITDDSVPLHKLCAKLEYMLQIDMKPSARSGMFAGKKDYWDYIYQCLYKVKGLNDGIHFVRGKSEVKTSLGRGRAFIRYSLTHHRLGDSLQQCFNNHKVTSIWYNPNSLLLNPSLFSPLINDLYDLNDLQFDLAPSGHDLDAAWPTSSHRNVMTAPGMYGHAWQLPIRTESLSSLSSQPSTADGYWSPTVESRPNAEAEMAQRVQSELEECEQVNRELRKRIIQLEKDNDEMHRLAMETEERMSAMQSELERKVQELQYQLEKASKESMDAKDHLSKKESDLQKKVEEAEKVNSDLCDRLEAINLQHASQERMWQESERAHNTKLLEGEQLLAEVRVELAGARSELNISQTSEAKKDEALRALEEKLSQMENKNAELLLKMEGMVDSKDAEVANHLQSANKVHELLDKLSEAEAKNLEVKGERDSLSRRVELLEDNCSSQEKEMVAKVADLEQGLVKEKDKSRVLNESLNNLKTEHAESVKELQGIVNTLSSEKDDLQSRLAEHVKLVEASKQLAESKESDGIRMKAELESSQQRWTDAHRDLERLRKELHAAGVQSEELKVRMKHTEELCQDRQREIEDLENQLKDHTQKQVEDANLIRCEKEKVANLERQLQDGDSHALKVKKEKEYIALQFEKVMQMVSKSTPSSGISTEHLQQSNCETDGGIDARTHVLQTQISHVLAERDDALKKVQDVQSTNDMLSTEIKSLTEKSSCDSKNVAETRERVERSQGEVASLQVKVDSMAQTLQNKEKSLQEQNMEIQQLEEQMRTQVEEKEKLEVDIVRIRLAIDGKDKERDELIGEKTKLEVRADELQASLNTIRKERESLEKKLTQQGEVISQLMLDVERLKTERQEAEESKEEVQKLLERERLNCRKLEDTVEDLKRLQVESVSLEQVYEERKTKMMQEHADKVEFLTEQFQMMKEEQEKTSGEQLHYQEQAETLGKELAVLREQCETLETENRAVKEKNNDLNLEILRMQEVVELSRTERDEISSKLEQVSTETSQHLQQTKVEMEQLQGRIHTSEKEGEERTGAIRTLEAELEGERRRAGELEAELEGAREEVARVQSTMEEEIAALKFQLSSEAMQYQQTLQSYQEQETEVRLLKAGKSEHEQTISELRIELTTLKQKTNQDKVSFQKKLTEQENEINRQERQINIHQESVEELSRCLEDEKRARTDLQAEVTVLRTENGSKMASLEEELAQALDDNEQLKKQLIKVIKEKDTYWQRTEKLEYHRKMKASERWMDDKQVTLCMLCECEFSLTVRKHHCRLCGKIFCSKCTNFFVLTSHSKKKSRVCEKCYVVHQHSLEAPSVNTSVVSHNSSGDDLEGRSPLPGEEGNGALGSSGMVSDEATSDIMTDSVCSEPVGVEELDYHASQTTQETDASKGQSEGTSRKLHTPSPVPTSENTASEPDFDIISEDEVTQARQDAGNTEEESRMNGDIHLLTTEELEGEGVSGAEVVVAAYMKHALTVAINEVGLMLCWEFVSSPKSIGFSATFQESLSSAGPPEELIPLCRCNSHQQAIQGELLARRPGVYTLIFDNKFSRFTSKTVKYSLQIKRPEAAY
ncbi:uncharacterized protein [Diadema antillarum]|uniref:uncharacterized protein n=1 Tax=Diadema antillarum TaxID=105358 RepID=UPI003A8C3085